MFNRLWYEFKNPKIKNNLKILMAIKINVYVKNVLVNF